MNKKISLLLAAITFLAILAVFFSLSKSSKKNIHSPVSENNLKIKTISPESKLTEYKDPSGFKFSYPQNLNLQKKQINDQTIYSLLELTSPKNQGKLEIRVEDSQLKKIDDWFLNGKLATRPADIKKIKLAEMDGRQFSEKGKFLTIALDQGVLFTFTVIPEKNKNFWLNVNEKIIKTFAFEPPENTGENTSNNNASSEEDVIFEGEEIIE